MRLMLTWQLRTAFIPVSQKSCFGLERQSSPGTTSWRALKFSSLSSSGILQTPKFSACWRSRTQVMELLCSMKSARNTRTLRLDLSSREKHLNSKVLTVRHWILTALHLAWLQAGPDCANPLTALRLCFTTILALGIKIKAPAQRAPFVTLVVSPSEFLRGSQFPDELAPDRLSLYIAPQAGHGSCRRSEPLTLRIGALSALQETYAPAVKPCPIHDVLQANSERLLRLPVRTSLPASGRRAV